MNVPHANRYIGHGYIGPKTAGRPAHNIRAGRFAASFPLLDKVLATHAAPLMILPCAILSAWYSINLGVSVLYVLVLWTAYRIDRRHLDTLLITPLSALAIYWFISLGLGPAFLSISKGGESAPELVVVQIVGLFGFTVFAGIYHLQCRRLPAIQLPRAESPGARSFYPALRRVALSMVAFTLAVMLIRVITGIGERGHVGAELDVELKGDIRVAFLAALYRFDLLGVMFTGLLIRSNRIMDRVLGFVAIGVYLVFGFTSGTRGLVLHSLVAFLCGYYAFGGSARAVKAVLLAGVVVGVPLISLMGVMRMSQDFYYSRISDVTTRLEVARDALSSIRAGDIANTLDLTGRALIGVSDELVYRDTPGVLPFAGWKGLAAVKLVLIPHFFRPGTDDLGDENEIVSSYTGVRIERSYWTISFFADMYRRFGIPGIVVGSMLAGWFYGTVSAFVMGLFHSRRKLYGMVMLMLMMAAYSLFPFSTLLRCSWLWFYDIPKHLLVLAALIMVVESTIPYARPAIESQARVGHA